MLAALDPSTFVSATREPLTVDHDGSGRWLRRGRELRRGGGDLHSRLDLDTLDLSRDRSGQPIIFQAVLLGLDLRFDLGDPLGIDLCDHVHVALRLRNGRLRIGEGCVRNGERLLGGRGLRRRLRQRRLVVEPGHQESGLIVLDGLLVIFSGGLIGAHGSLIRCDGGLCLCHRAGQSRAVSG